MRAQLVMKRRWVTLMLALFTAIAFLLAGAVLPGTTPVRADEAVEVPATVEPAPIAAFGFRNRPPVEGHTFTFAVDVSPCLGPGLTLDHVTVVERPESADHVRAAIVTAYLFHPAHIQGGPCTANGVFRIVRVRTKRPAADLVFFDGSSSPPHRVWPPVKSRHTRTRRSQSCGSAKGKTLLAGRRARIYSLPGSKPPWTERVFGCLSSVSRVWQLSPIGESSWPVRMGEPFVLRAPWAAGLESKHGRDTLRLAIGVRDLRTGVYRSCAVGFGFNPSNKPSVAGFVLKRNGSVAWIGKSRVPGTSRRAPAVGACDSTGEHFLDSGEGIDLHSLALHGSTLTWTDSGVTRLAPLN